jgi:TRAP-type C4-dicarboxylate transport system permease small subunit
LSALGRLVDRISGLCGFIAGALLLAACAVITESVFVRYVLEASTIWQTEFVKYAVVGSTLLGSPYVLASRGHVKVDLISERLARPAALRFELLAAVVGCAFCIVLAWSGWHYFYDAWRLGWSTESVWAPRLWIILLPLPLGAGLTCAQYAVAIARLAAARRVPTEHVAPNR